MNQPPNSSKADYTLSAKALLRRARYGVLSTFSKQVPGYPFGSVLPCALTTVGEPILFISTLAAHTQNILADPHVSFTAVEPDKPAETQANGRFTYMGIAEAVPEEQVDRLRERFVTLVPGAKLYSSFGDFKFYIIRFTKGRFVGGFGAIGWIHADAYTQPDPVAELAIAERSSLETLCRQSLQKLAQVRGLSHVALVNADSQGCDIGIEDSVVRTEFAQPLAGDSSCMQVGEAIAIAIEPLLSQ